MELDNWLERSRLLKQKLTDGRTDRRTSVGLPYPKLSIVIVGFKISAPQTLNVQQKYPSRSMPTGGTPPHPSFFGDLFLMFFTPLKESD